MGLRKNQLTKNHRREAPITHRQKRVISKNFPLKKIKKTQSKTSHNNSAKTENSKNNQPKYRPKISVKDLKKVLKN
jgi:hypothetical protein